MLRESGGVGGRKQADPPSRKSNVLSNIDNSTFSSLRLILSLCLPREVLKRLLQPAFLGCWLEAEASSFLNQDSGDMGGTAEWPTLGTDVSTHPAEDVSGSEFTFKTQWNQVQKTQRPDCTWLSGTEDAGILCGRG